MRHTHDMGSWDVLVIVLIAMAGLALWASIDIG